MASTVSANVNNFYFVHYTDILKFKISFEDHQNYILFLKRAFTIVFTFLQFKHPAWISQIHRDVT